MARARGLSVLLKNSQGAKELVKKSLAVGNRMFFSGDISRREAVSKPLLENAISSFLDQGYLARVDGKLELSESFQSQKAVATIESRIALFLGEGAS